LREQKVLDGRNVPYREYEDRGYFRVIEQKWADSEGETHISLKTLAYQKGIEYIRRLVSQEIPQAERHTEILVFPNTQGGAV
jgi:phage antirepressor YoqD-like protein